MLTFQMFGCNPICISTCKLLKEISFYKKKISFSKTLNKKKVISGNSELIWKNNSHYKETTAVLHISQYSLVGTEDGSNKQLWKAMFHVLLQCPLLPSQITTYPQTAALLCAYHISIQFSKSVQMQMYLQNISSYAAIFFLKFFFRKNLPCVQNFLLW